MSAPFAMLGDPDAGLCVDGVCALPAAEREPQEGADAGPVRGADGPDPS